MSLVLVVEMAVLQCWRVKAHDQSQTMAPLLVKLVYQRLVEHDSLEAADQEQQMACHRLDSLDSNCTVVHVKKNIVERTQVGTVA